MTTPPPVKHKNTLGLIALTLSLIGFVLACIPASIDVGWIVLGIAFLVGIVGTFKSGQPKNVAVAAVVVSVLGVVVSAAIVVFAVSGLFVDLFVNLFDYIFNNSGRTGG